ncbi:MAG: hypothetical protein HQM08_05505 [Candidatus Riflebacteria bacterium]|nr:hypothetical protein [Candidatus Riflebacteria bacterium]
MTRNLGQLLYGYVEQAVCGGLDPLSPAISISTNGSLAKWRGKFQVLDFRVNDPGLKKYRQSVEGIVEKAKVLGIEVNITLPEGFSVVVDAPPPPPTQNEAVSSMDRSSGDNRFSDRNRNSDRTYDSFRARDDKRPENSNDPQNIIRDGRKGRFSKLEPEPIREKIACYYPCYLAIPRTATGQILKKNPGDLSHAEILSLIKSTAGGVFYHKLTLEDVAPIVELAIKHEARRLIVPVSEPGFFLDPHAEREFKAIFLKIHEMVKGKPIELCLKNGGLFGDFFNKLNHETGCGLVYNIGTAYIERQDYQAFYEQNKDKISALIFHQLVPGVDKWHAWREASMKAFQRYIPDLEEYERISSLGNETDRITSVKRLLDSYFNYIDTRKNIFFNLGLFQSGEINLVPFLRILKSDLREGKEIPLIIESVPNLKNSQFFDRYLARDFMPSPL